jgi:hypothetical protein
MFENGVYIIDGQKVEELDGDFESFFKKYSSIGKILNYEAFMKYGDSKFMLIIDDFNLIKPRSNGRFKFFM